MSETSPAAPQGAPHPLAPAPQPAPAAPVNPSNFDPSMDQGAPRRRAKGLMLDLFHCVLHHGPRTGCPPFESAEHYRGQQVTCPSCGSTSVRPVPEDDEDAARAEIAAAKKAAAPAPTNPDQEVMSQ